MHGCRQLVSWDVWLSPITSATPVFFINRLLRKSQRKVGMMSSLYVLYVLGCTRSTMVSTMRSKNVSSSKTLKLILVRIGLCNETVKVESLVIVDQNATVNLSLTFVHTARQAMKVGCSWKIFLWFFLLFFFTFSVLLVVTTNYFIINFEIVIDNCG